MKKITFLLLAILPFLATAQTFNFTNADDGWSTLSGFTAANGATFMTLTTVDGDGTLKNPTIGTTTANVNTAAVNYIGVTIRNNDATGPDYMRVSYPKTTSGRIYKNLDITTGDSGFVTYWFDLSNGTHWTGTMNDVKLHFKSAGNSNYTLPNNPNNVSIDIDKIEFSATLPRPEKLVYEFNTDGDDEGYSSLVAATSSVSGGALILTPDGTGAAKVTNGVNSVDANANSHIHIIYKNNSATNDQVRLQFRSSVDGYVSFIGTNASINQSMSSFGTLTLDLETLKPAEWSDTAQDIQIAVRNTGNAGNAANADGTFEIDRIVFNSDVTLSTSDFEQTSFALYPNPASDILNIKGNVTIFKVSIFDITGKKVMETTKLNNNTLNIATLNNGVYLVKLTDGNGNKTIKKLIKN